MLWKDNSVIAQDSVEARVGAVSLAGGYSEKLPVTLTTTVVSETWIDIRYILEESLTVIDGLNTGVKEKEKSRRNHTYQLITWKRCHLLRWRNLGCSQHFSHSSGRTNGQEFGRIMV